MYRDIAKLVLYRDLGEDSILMKLSGIFEDFDLKRCENAELCARIYDQIKRLLDLATSYGFDKNLWHNYLAFILITNENSFSITSEKVGANDGTVNYFAKNDFKIFKKLFDFDFSEIESALGIDCFSTINNYKSIGKKERMYNKNVSEKVQAVSNAIEEAENEDQIFDIVTEFYKAYGVGMFGLNKAFRITREHGDLEFVPINNTEDVMLDDLIGYEIQKKKIVDNTEAFVEGRKANNALLFGDSGTGKSTTIKAIINEYYDRGLRMIEIYKHQFQDLSSHLSRTEITDLSYTWTTFHSKSLRSSTSISRLSSRADLRSDLTMYSSMPHRTVVISSRRHGTTGMIWRITMVFTEVILSRRNCHLSTDSESRSAIVHRRRRSTSRSSRDLLRRSISPWMRRSSAQRPTSGNLPMAE